MKDLVVQDAPKRDLSWFFSFSNSVTVATESAWRLFVEGNLIVASGDDGQQFGLREQVDATGRVLAVLAGTKVQTAKLRHVTSDLTIEFENGAILDFLNTSCGFESWRVGDETDQFICVGGRGVVRMLIKNRT